MNATDVSARPADAPPIEAAKTLTEKVPATFRLGLVTFSDYAEQRVAPTTDRRADPRRPRPARGRGRHGDGRRARARAVRRPHAGPERQRHRRPPAPVGDRAALGRQEHVRHARSGRGRARGRAARGSRSTRSRSARPRARSSCATRSASSSASRCRRTPRRSRRSRGSPAASSYTATETDKVKEIYANLGTRLSSRSEKREVTAFFAGGALFLLVAAGGLSLRWFGRLI